MVHRILIGAIVCFWIVMTSQLIRLEVNPDRSDLLTVPPAHVFKLMFIHGQSSELNVLDNQLPIGNLTLNPRSDTETNKHTLDMNGNVLVHLAGAAKKQRVSWDGIIEMDRFFKATNFQLTLNLLPVNPRETIYHLHLSLDPVTKQVNYEIKEGDQSVKNSSFSADAAGLAALLRDEFGFDASFIQNVHSNIGTPTLSAKQTEIKIHNEKTVAYLLTVKQGEVMAAEIYVSQLGQILSAKTILGYTLTASDSLP